MPYRAYEIVSFHKGYTFGEAIQYVRRENVADGNADDVIAADINALNGYMADADKAACDNEIAEWLYVAGTGYRLTMQNNAWQKDGRERKRARNKAQKRGAPKWVLLLFIRLYLPPTAGGGGGTDVGAGAAHVIVILSVCRNLFGRGKRDEFSGGFCVLFHIFLLLLCYETVMGVEAAVTPLHSTTTCSCRFCARNAS